MPNYTILLIDYEPKSIERLRRPLLGCGYRVEVATDGITGIEAFHRLSPDLVMVEAMIPKKHGFEVCSELKKTPHGKQTPVIITTSVYKGRKYRTQAFHLHGCDEYIEKPIDDTKIVEICNRLLAIKHPEDFLSTAPVPEPEPVVDETPSLPETAAPAMHAQPARSPLAPQLPVDDDEMEILARLDAILPGARSQPSMATASDAAQHRQRSVAADPESREDTAASDAEPSEPRTAVATASLEPSDEPFAIDLEAEPEPEVELVEEETGADAVAEPAAAETSAEDGDPQIISFDSRRGRKKGRRKKRGGSGAAAHRSAGNGSGGGSVASQPVATPEPARVEAPEAIPEATPEKQVDRRVHPPVDHPGVDVDSAAVASTTRATGSRVWLWVVFALLALAAGGTLVYHYLALAY